MRLRARMGANAFAGTYRVRLPPHFEDVSGEGLAGISNGIDEHMAAAVRARGPTGSSRCPRWATTRWTCRNQTTRGGSSPTACGTGPTARAAARAARGGPRGGPRRGKGRGVPAAAPSARRVVGRAAPGLGGLQGREGVELCRVGYGARVGACQGPARMGPQRDGVLGDGAGQDRRGGPPARCFRPDARRRTRPRRPAEAAGVGRRRARGARGRGSPPVRIRRGKTRRLRTSAVKASSSA